MWPDKETVAEIRKKYPPGTRIRLLEMKDVQSIPVGTEGTVTHVDDIGSLCVTWDNGRSLHVLHGIDKCEII